jgi:hypothetical protein
MQCLHAYSTIATMRLTVGTTTSNYFLGSVCSGNGACVYSDPSGSALSSCAITDVRCTATCACKDGFGGSDCTLTTAALLERGDLR